MLVTLSCIARPQQRCGISALDRYQGDSEPVDAAFALAVASGDRTQAEASCAR
jgi:hypothetical protein